MKIQNIKKLNNLKSSPKYQIIDEEGTVYFRFHSVDFLITSEIFTYNERQQLRNFETISEGRYKGFRMVET